MREMVKDRGSATGDGPVRDVDGGRKRDVRLRECVAGHRLRRDRVAAILHRRLSGPE
jgi:hypothetical protein